MKTISIAVLFAASVAALPATASQCAPHKQMAQMLWDHFGEDQSYIGQASDGRVVELYTAPSQGTWSLVVTAAGQRSCIIASGTEGMGEDPLHLVQAMS